jgi:hypothetical protein
LEGSELAASLRILEPHEVVDAVLDGVEVREGAAQPARGDEGHAAAPRLASIVSCAWRFVPTKHSVPPLATRSRTNAQAFRAGRRLLKVEDVDAVAR